MLRRRLVVLAAVLLAALALPSGEARAQGTTLDGRPPFYARLSNIRPLVFGMDIEQVSAALKQPLQYVSGPPGAKVLTMRTGRAGHSCVHAGAGSTTLAARTSNAESDDIAIFIMAARIM